MNEKIKDVEPPAVPTPSSYYGSEEDTAAYERAIAEIMKRDQVSRQEAERIYNSEP